MRKSLLFKSFLGFMLLTTVAFAQDRVISGKVTAIDDGSTLPGVNVVLKGTTLGTVTDVNGSYSLSIPASGGTLAFSFIGLKLQEVEVGSRTVIDINMESDATQLSEVIVTGYSEGSTRTNTAAVGKVSSTALQNVPLTDVNQMLQGRVAGVFSSAGSGQPGSVQSIQIRGRGSINAGSTPLYVIDGIPVTSGDISQSGGQTNSPSNSMDVMANINPNDIENVTILKDAAATSLYGSRGANGVVLITTKRGKSGGSTITARAQYGVTVKNTGNFNMMNGQQAWQYERDMLAANGTSQANIDLQRPVSQLDSTFNWLDAAFRQGQTTNYEIQAQGGDEKTKFFISGGIYKQEGALIQTDFSRYSIRANFDHKLNEKFDLSFNFNTSYTDQLNAAPGNNFASPLLGSFSTTPLQNPINAETGKPYTGLESNYIGFTGDNFLYSAPLNPNKNNTLRSLGKLALNYQLTKNIRLSQTGGVDLINIKEVNYFDPTTNDGFGTQGFLTNANTQDLTLTSQSKVSGNWTIGTKHNFDALGIFEVVKNDNSNQVANGSGFANGKLKTLNSAATPQPPAGSSTGWGLVSIIGQLTYNLSGKYIVTGSFRRDGSSRFGSDVRYANFGSVGASWRMIDESFISNLDIFTDLKLRASYGSAGNQNIGNFLSQELYGFGAAYNNVPGSGPSQIANPGLTWERSTTINIGLDFGIVNDRIRGSVDVYRKSSDQLLLSVPVSSTTGFTTAFRNAGKIENSGIEGTITTTNTTGKLKWTTDFNITAQTSKVLELPNNNADIIPGLNIYRVGEQVTTFYMREWAGVNPANGTPLWKTSDGGTTGSYATASRFNVGSFQPKLMGGLSNTLAYNGLSLSFFFYYSWGNSVYNQSRAFIESDGQRFGWNHIVEAAQDYWKSPGDIVSRPKPIPGGNAQSNSVSSRFLEDGSYVRLRNVVLGYNLPTSILGKYGFKNVRVYVQGQNLLTWTKYSGFDPEMDATGSEFFRFPVGKSYTAGVEVTF
ncbi:SusC/RagA family TonB-linked outer membrane protein [soil metagenome]